MKKQFTSLLTLTLLFSSLVGCGNNDSPKKVDKDISIIYTTDVHCGVSDNLGYAKLSDYRNKLEETNYVALVDSGDYLQGGFIGTISKGEYVMDIVNEMDYDVLTLGNHEFDYGIDILKERLDTYSGDIVSCNFSYIGKKENKLDMVKPYVIKEYGNRKVGFIGVTTPTTLTSSDPRIFIEDDEVAYDFGASTKEHFYSLVQDNINSCKADGADYIIMLSHLGSLDVYNPYSSIDVINNTTGVLAFLDGHSHVDLPWTTVKNKNDENTLLVGAGTKLNEFASITISTSGEISTSFINEYEDIDIDMDNYVKSIEELAKEEGDKVVSTIDVDLNGERSLVRTREAPIGNLISDAYKNVANADIGVVNGGGIRAGLTKGEVTYREIMDVHPFGNNLMLKKTKGSSIRDYLEYCYMKVTNVVGEGEFGTFSQVSGLKCNIDTSIESTVVVDETTGNFIEVAGARRVKDIKVYKNGEYVDLVDSEDYTIASHDFLLESGGGGANMFINDETIPTPALLDYEVLIHYISEVLGGSLADKYSTTDNRINILS